MTFNIKQLLFWVAYHNINDIIQVIMEKNCTIVCLQEVFSDLSKESIVKQLRDKYPFIIKKVNKKSLFGLGEDSGLMILSKIPFEKSSILRKTFCSSGHVDMFSNKGFIKIEYNMSGTKFCLINTHLQSDYGNDNSYYKHIRKIQINDINKHVRKKTSTILCGDLNIDNSSDEFKTYNWFSYHKSHSVFSCPSDNCNYDHLIILNNQDNIKMSTHYVEHYYSLSDHNPVVALFDLI